ncbi:TPA: hypothetical protein MEB24_003900 [Klebsiella aerogenes]|uniref:antiviral RADAR system adenosine deaminase RdrB n=1 Tax=Klebsiella aerogenes TaxID=548 RepID=UPI000D5819AC|nr:antiviral RADAR system adenosine deaminase RdrB [Klebsiella aerogenes]PVF76126.1 adenosine/AMP deaminase family protein [Klebsiella aerogenes]HBW0111766.1 hypothetical protein [Klebsiella aerogenes]
MLNLDLHWLVPTILMGSDRIMINGFDQELYNKRLNWAECYQSAIRDYQSYFPGVIRKEDFKKMLSIWGVDINSPPELLEILSKLKNEFISWGGDRFEVNHRQLENWLSLLSQVDPVWVISFGYAELIEKRILSVEQVISLLKKQCPNALPSRFDNEPIADNHVHLGGHGHYNLSLASLLLYLEKRPEHKSFNCPYRIEHSLFNSKSILNKDLPVVLQYLFDRLLSMNNNVLYNINDCSWSYAVQYSVSPQVHVLKNLPLSNDVNHLLIASTDEEGHSSWIMIATSIVLQLMNPKTASHKSLLQTFIQCSSIMRNYMVVSGVGLGDFVTFFGFKYRKPLYGINYKAQSIVHDLLPNYFREFRSGMCTIKDYIRVAKLLCENNLAKQIHFIYHFSRGFSNNITANRIYEYSRKNTFSTVRDFQDFLRSITYGDFSLLKNNSIDQVQIDLRAMIRGFDVAGNENEVPIEVFAPALRVIRSALHHHMHPLEKRLRQPFITLHAGEDFSHIVSGLRSIDESVSFCDFHPNDRIGHGLALGICVKEWAERQARIYLPLQEHLDNLVWLYHKGTELINRSPQFHVAILSLSEKIRYYCNELYNKDFSPLALYQAWFLRRNCPIQSLNEGEVLGDEWQLWVPDFELIRSGNISNDSVELWKKYLARSRHDIDNDRLVSIRYQPEMIMCDYGRKNNNYEEVMSLCEIELIEAIQDLMIERFSQSQWVLEVCPTSNIYIGRLEKYEEHPIFRWNPPKRDYLLPGAKYNKFGLRKGPVRVCINTDDAGLMPTTLENEYRIIKECAIKKHDVSDLDACQWIDNIRKTGVELFKMNHLEWQL